MPKGTCLGQEFWRNHERAWRSSGLTQVGYCEQHGLAITTFARWHGRFSKEEKVVAKDSSGPGDLRPKGPALVPVALSEPSDQGPSGSAAPDSSRALKVRLKGSPWEVEIGRDFEAKQLAKLLTALQSIKQ